MIFAIGRRIAEVRQMDDDARRSVQRDRARAGFWVCENPMPTVAPRFSIATSSSSQSFLTVTAAVFASIRYARRFRA